MTRRRHRIADQVVDTSLPNWHQPAPDPAGAEPEALACYEIWCSTD